MDLYFLSMRQKMLLQVLQSDLEKRIVAKFIRNDFRPQSESVLLLAGGRDASIAIALLVGRGWLARRKERFVLTARVIDHLRDKDQEDLSSLRFLSKEASRVVRLFSKHQVRLLPYSSIWQELGADAFVAVQELLDDGWIYRTSPARPKGKGFRLYHQPAMYSLSGKALKVLDHAS